jgi:hypothetical protein
MASVEQTPKPAPRGSDDGFVSGLEASVAATSVAVQRALSETDSGPKATTASARTAGETAGALAALRDRLRSALEWVTESERALDVRRLHLEAEKRSSGGGVAGSSGRSDASHGGGSGGGSPSYFLPDALWSLVLSFATPRTRSQACLAGRQLLRVVRGLRHTITVTNTFGTSLITATHASAGLLLRGDNQMVPDARVELARALCDPLRNPSTGIGATSTVDDFDVAFWRAHFPNVRTLRLVGSVAMLPSSISALERSFAPFFSQLTCLELAGALGGRIDAQKTLSMCSQLRVLRWSGCPEVSLQLVGLKHLEELRLPHPHSPASSPAGVLTQVRLPESLRILELSNIYQPHGGGFDTIAEELLSVADEDIDETSLSAAMATLRARGVPVLEEINLTSNAHGARALFDRIAQRRARIDASRQSEVTAQVSASALTGSLSESAVFPTMPSGEATKSAIEIFGALCGLRTLQLKWLSGTGSRLAELPPSVTSLDLSHSDVDSLPVMFSTSRKLRVLRASASHITLSTIQEQLPYGLREFHCEQSERLNPPHLSAPPSRQERLAGLPDNSTRFSLDLYSRMRVLSISGAMLACCTRFPLAMTTLRVHGVLALSDVARLRNAEHLSRLTLEFAAEASSEHGASSLSGLLPPALSALAIKGFRDPMSLCAATNDLDGLAELSLNDCIVSELALGTFARLQCLRLYACRGSFSLEPTTAAVALPLLSDFVGFCVSGFSESTLERLLYHAPALERVVIQHCESLPAPAPQRILRAARGEEFVLGSCVLG